MRNYHPLIGHSELARRIGCTLQALTGRRNRGTVPDPDTKIDGRPYWYIDTVKHLFKDGQ